MLFSVLPNGPNSVRCLILACGNTLRGDDGVGPWLADWAEERFGDEPAVRVIACHQWTPDLAEDIARADSVIFLDCAINAEPGQVQVARVEPACGEAGLATHHVGAAELLALSRDLYSFLPRNALLLTVGASSTDMAETFSESVLDALPEACETLDRAVRRFLVNE